MTSLFINFNPDSKVGWADVGPTLGRQARRWPNVGPTKLAIWEWPTVNNISPVYNFKIKKKTWMYCTTYLEVICLTSFYPFYLCVTWW